MIQLKNVKTLSDTIEDLTLPSDQELVIDCEETLLRLPGLVHAHAKEHAEDRQAALIGGVTTVGTMLDRLQAGDRPKKLCKKTPLSLAVNLHDKDEQAVEEAFRLAAQQDLMVAALCDHENPRLVEQAITLTDKYHCRLYLLHLGTKEELAMIRQARAQQILVFAETCPRHLFSQGEAQEALWEAIHDGLIDSVGCDDSNAGGAGMAITLPLLLHACNEGKITLEQIVRVMRINLEHIYDLPRSSDAVLIDMHKKITVDAAMIQRNSAWAPYASMQIKGWPITTIADGIAFKVSP